MTQIQKHFFKIQKSLETVSVSSLNTVGNMVQDFIDYNFVKELDLKFGNKLDLFFYQLNKTMHKNYSAILLDILNDKQKLIGIEKF